MFETLVQMLHEQRETISQKWDETSRRQLIQYLESYLKSGEVMDEFFILCGEKFPKPTASTRTRYEHGDSDDNDDVKILVNEIVEAIRKPSLKSGKNEAVESVKKPSFNSEKKEK